MLIVVYFCFSDWTIHVFMIIIIIILRGTESKLCQWHLHNIWLEWRHTNLDIYMQTNKQLFGDETNIALIFSLGMKIRVCFSQRA